MTYPCLTRHAKRLRQRMPVSAQSPTSVEVGSFTDVNECNDARKLHCFFLECEANLCCSRTAVRNKPTPHESACAFRVVDRHLPTVEDPSICTGHPPCFINVRAEVTRQLAEMPPVAQLSIIRTRRRTRLEVELGRR
jgi:hypothetical protein